MTALLYGPTLITDLHGTAVCWFVFVWMSLSEASTPTDVNCLKKRTDTYAC